MLKKALPGIVVVTDDRTEMTYNFFSYDAGVALIGLPGIPADIVALLTLNLRAIGEYATYYGFDVTLPSERRFALNILGLASSPTVAAKQLAMAQLVKIAQETARKSAWKQLENYAFVQVVQQISKALGIRLTKDKLAQVLPVLGAVIGGGFDAYFTSNVCQAAYYLYRERFLAKSMVLRLLKKPLSLPRISTRTIRKRMSRRPRKRAALATIQAQLV